MKSMLFDSFEPQLVRAADAKDTHKRDLLARIYGPEPIDPAAISAGLRYNVNPRPAHDVEMIVTVPIGSVRAGDAETG